MCLAYTKYVRGEEKFPIVNLVDCTVGVTEGKCSLKYLSSCFQNWSA